MSRAERRASKQAAFTAARTAEKSIPAHIANYQASTLALIYSDFDFFKKQGGIPQYPASEQEALDRLKKLAEGIDNGTVNTHSQVTEVVSNLGTGFLNLNGGETIALDQAAARVNIAIVKKGTTFTDPDPTGSQVE